MLGCGLTLGAQGPSRTKGDGVEYGPFASAPPFTFAELRIHFATTAVFATFTSVRRDIQVHAARLLLCGVPCEPVCAVRANRCPTGAAWRWRSTMRCRTRARACRAPSRALTTIAACERSRKLGHRGRDHTVVRVRSVGATAVKKLKAVLPRGAVDG